MIFLLPSSFSRPLSRIHALRGTRTSMCSGCVAAEPTATARMAEGRATQEQLPVWLVGVPTPFMNP